MDKATLKLLLLVLALFEVVILGGIFYLLAVSKDIPDFIVAASASILTAMLGLAIPHDVSEQVGQAVAAAVNEPAPVVPPVEVALDTTQIGY